MAQIIRGDVQVRVNWFNEHNANYRIRFSRRYNYFALDLYRKSDGGMLDTLFTGTVRECYTYMIAMLKGIDLSV